MSYLRFCWFERDDTILFMLDDLTSSLHDGMSLDSTAIEGAIDAMVREEHSAEQKAAFLTALANKGETVEEISGFACGLRAMAIAPPIDRSLRDEAILDVCGTGGDHQNTFNISTTVALVLAASGVTVAKHGNRAITSRSGSADVLEALGIPVDLPPDQAAASLQDHGFAFLFAPHYHPAFKHIVPARKLCAAQGQRTIFNFLGPLLNPVQPSAQLIGVPRPDLCSQLGQVLQSMGVERGMVVCGSVGEAGFLDELSTLGENHVAEFYQGRGFHESSWRPDGFVQHEAKLSDLAGGDANHNAQLVRDILAGTLRGPKRDAVLLNSSAALLVAGKVSSMQEGWDKAAKTIDSGQAEQKLASLTKKSV
ncbi:MAG: anthranilate phosphoribosyltransferase [Verrucomicrobiota bacterium]|nr:anthranilate phosphoribosyltransferase [Verrucomicrobiota bacterium]